jgi:hypothetical protein
MFKLICLALKLLEGIRPNGSVIFMSFLDSGTACVSQLYSLQD